MARRDKQEKAETIPVTVRFPADVLDRLERVATSDRRSLSAEIVWFVEAAIRVAEEAQEETGT